LFNIIAYILVEYVGNMFWYVLLEERQKEVFNLYKYISEIMMMKV